ncbi:MAG: hypothetical protein K2X98_05195 [Alphaproteobacteria bacterium]|nr:hypothetical protein [Alphaproteobacteria bacterium]
MTLNIIRPLEKDCYGDNAVSIDKSFVGESYELTFQKGWLYLWIWSVGALIIFILSMVGIFSVTYDYDQWNSEKNALEERLVIAKDHQEKAKTLMARDDVRLLDYALKQPFDKDHIVQRDVEAWVSRLSVGPGAMSFDVSVTFDKDECPQLFGGGFVGRLLTFRIKTYTDTAFFALLKQMTTSPPFYYEVQGYTLKRLQPLTDDVLMDIKQGRKAYLFEGNLDVLAVAPAFDEAHDVVMSDFSH